MKILGQIKDIVLDREYTRQDGTTASIFNVVIASGDDELLAQTFSSVESMERRGIKVGSIGNARIELQVRSWIDREGKNRKTQQVSLADWRPATTTTTNPSQQEVAAQMAEATQRAENEGAGPF